MLYNQDWNRKPEPWTLASLIAWLETKDPKAHYCYTSSTNCLLSQYAKAMGFKAPSASGRAISFSRFSWYVPFGRKHMPLPVGFNEIAIYGNTFGGALQRAKDYSIFLQVQRPKHRTSVSHSASA